MNTSSPSDALMRAIESDPHRASEDRLAQIRAVAAAVREADAQILDIEESLKETKSRRERLVVEVLPDLMDGAGVPSLTLAADGNLPAVKVEVGTHYFANIAAGWEPERRAAAMSWFDDHGSGDLVKTTLTMEFSRDKRAEAVSLARQLRLDGREVNVIETVHFMTLTSWLKERHRASLELPPLDLIGGHIARVATLKKIKVK